MTWGRQPIRLGRQDNSPGWQPKDKIPVVVFFAMGEPIICCVLCAPEEPVSDVINQDQPFLLVESDGGNVSLIKKTQIKMIVPKDVQSLTFMMASADGERLAITFLDGTGSEGVIYLPDGMRASDIANSTTPFFLFRPDDGTPEYVCNYSIQQITINT